VDEVKEMRRCEGTRLLHASRAKRMRRTLPTIRVILKSLDTEGRIMTKRYQNAKAYVNSTTNLLQVYRSDGPAFEDQDMLAEFQADASLSWKETALPPSSTHGTLVSWPFRDGRMIETACTAHVCRRWKESILPHIFSEGALASCSTP
jgi:hypothetical protein